MDDEEKCPLCDSCTAPSQDMPLLADDAVLSGWENVVNQSLANEGEDEEDLSE
jgi:hypothetical protein